MDKAEEVNRLMGEAIALHKINWREAVKKYSEVLTISGDFPEARADAANNIGVLLLHNGFSEQAKKAFEICLSVHPTHSDCLTNIGNLSFITGDHKKAEECYNAALLINKVQTAAKMNCGSIKLLLGEYATGWDLYENRWQSENWGTIPITHDKPKWNGEDLSGKRILLTGEQGIGDAVQFIRYAPMVSDLGGYVMYHGHRETHELFAGVRGISERFCMVDLNDIPPDSYDYHISLMSLPRVFKTTVDTVPADVPYIQLPTQTHDPLPDGLNVGVVWRGRPQHTRDRWRSMKLETLAPIAMEGVNLWALQFDAAQQELDSWSALSRYGNGFRDMIGWSQAIQQMDVIVTVDTSAAHVAGAIGKPVFLMLPANPDWRWMLDRTDSPWYPTVRLFRQEKLGDWTPVITGVKEALEKLCKA